MPCFEYLSHKVFKTFDLPGENVESLPGGQCPISAYFYCSDSKAMNRQPVSGLVPRGCVTFGLDSFWIAPDAEMECASATKQGSHTVELLAMRLLELSLASCLIGTCLPACAQTNEFLPEIDVYSKLRGGVRFQFQAKQTREAGEPVQAEFGPSVDFYAHSWLRLAEVNRFDLDDAKPRPLVLSVGYRYLPEANGGAATNRMEPVATARFPMTHRFLLTDRNRFDLDWKSSGFAWRYRNRVQIEGPVAIRSYHVKPYASVEAFYQSTYGKWSDTAIYVGCLFPIRKHVQLDPYYEHQNNTGKRPNEQLNQFGLVLNLFF